MPNVDEIKLVVGVCPASFMLDVVHDEENILRNPVGLNRGKVHSMKSGCGISIGHCDVLDHTSSSGLECKLGFPIMNPRNKQMQGEQLTFDAPFPCARAEVKHFNTLFESFLKGYQGVFTVTEVDSKIVL